MITAQYATLHTKDLFLQVQSIIREFRPKSWVIRDDQGELLTEIDQRQPNEQAVLSKVGGRGNQLGAPFLATLAIFPGENRIV
ncbi:unnamed protein product [Pieris macdunnoughi]|uniref:Uncharacterized protein n=1 Tax=Pieris macdunnoughi TaxID=345717 RepID=A0A821QLK6_9NEOP|nr:unnamed protein product [Pieris macdunnoughi]